MNYCSECKVELPSGSWFGTGLCGDCYERMFHDYKDNFPIKTIIIDDEEPDFEIKSDIATVSGIDNSKLVYTNGHYQDLRFTNPKHMVFNPDARVKDYDKLILFLLENYTIYESAKGFDKVSYMFKEYKKEDK